MYQMTPNLYSSRQGLIDDAAGIDYTPAADKLSYLDPLEPSWDNYLKGFNSNGKDRDSGLVHKSLNFVSMYFHFNLKDIIYYILHYILYTTCYIQ